MNVAQDKGEESPSIINMVGMAQSASAPDCGSGGRGFESLYPPSFFGCLNDTLGVIFIGLSPSGKAQHFDCCSRWFESS